MKLGRSEAKLQARVAEVLKLLEKHAVLEALAQRQPGARREVLEHLQHQQNLVELQTWCRLQHPADLAYVLEALPRDARALVWSQTAAPLRGLLLVEVSDTVREWLVEASAREDLVLALQPLDADDLAYLEGQVPEDVWQEVSRVRDAGEQTFLREAIAWPDDTVGHVMSHEFASVREGTSIRDAVDELRRGPDLPPHTDQLFVVDARRALRGSVSLDRLLRAAPETPIDRAARDAVVAFGPEEPLDGAVRVFERYGLVSAPVIDDRGRLLGRVTFDVILERARAAADRTALEQAGLSGEEDLFAPIVDSARNRWPWLGLNLLTAVLASRVIGLFEGTIAEFAALAALMPVVASIGGNTGNQTVALVVRGIALERFSVESRRHLIKKELQVAGVNGALWGLAVGGCALLFYRNVTLGIVMTTAVFANLIVAALAGVLVPFALKRANRDPAQGASVILTFVTDSVGFFIVLLLAKWFLV